MKQQIIVQRQFSFVRVENFDCDSNRTTEFPYFQFDTAMAEPVEMNDEAKVEQTIEERIRMIDRDVAHYQKKCQHPEKIVSFN